ncbi:hypothetical protein CIK05_06685 [Bdellovibrio sp. qaytius]|nr:hypothetical protein CIK05_06685 [Bdellovibrio sp. qaytius]
MSGQVTTASYDPQDRLTNYNTLSFQYNANGEVSSKKNSVTNQAAAFTFNSFSQLLGVKSGSNSIDYQMDGFGRRVQNSLNGKLQNSFIYMNNRLMGILGADGVLIQRYAYSSKSHVPDQIITKTEAYRIITDYLGSVRLVVRLRDGAIVQEMMHDEFGRVEKNTAPGFQPFGFSGGLYDANTTLVQFGARWYDPEIGRWLSKDPSLFNGGENLYAYAENNPINLIDVTGLSPQVPTIGEGGLSAGGGGGGAILLPAIQGIVNLLSERLPYDGPKGGSLVLPGNDGEKIQERFYDENGEPIKDYDWHPDHGAGTPHVHDWEPQPFGPRNQRDRDKKRGPGRKPEPGECE